VNSWALTVPVTIPGQRHGHDGQQSLSARRRYRPAHGGVDPDRSALDRHAAAPVCTEDLNSDVVVMEAAEEWM